MSDVKRNDVAGLAARLLADDGPSRVHWRRGEAPVLRGEFKVLLGRHGVYPSEHNVAAMVSLVPLVLSRPEKYRLAGENGSVGEAMAPLLFNRFGGLSNPDLAFSAEMKRWMRSESDLFLSSILPSLLRYHNSSGERTIPLDLLLRFAFQWDRYREDLITGVSTGFYRLRHPRDGS